MGMEYYSHYWHIAYGRNASKHRNVMYRFENDIQFYSSVVGVCRFTQLNIHGFRPQFHVAFSFPLLSSLRFSCSSPFLYSRHPPLFSYAIHTIFLILLLTNDCLRQKWVCFFPILIPSVCLLLHLEHYLEITYLCIHYIGFESHFVWYVYTFIWFFLTIPFFASPFVSPFYCFACGKSRFQILHTSTLKNLMSTSLIQIIIGWNMKRSNAD